MNSNERLDVIKELHRPARRKYPRRRTIVHGIDDLWQADLAEFQLYNKENKGFKFILVVIDCFSKFVWTAALKDKSGPTTTQAMRVILKEKRVPKNLQTDNGKEFYNSNFKTLMNDFTINHYSTYSIIKASIVERVIRSLKEMLYRQFSERGNYKWYDILEQITKNYNERKHRTINMRPCDVQGSRVQNKLLSTVYSNIKIAGVAKYKVGDYVRISKQKAAFAKGYTPNWTTELFKIRSVKITNPVTYLLEDCKQQPIQGAFYEQELQKAKHKDVYLIEKILRRKGAQMYVKWLGLDNSHNSWINKTL